MPRAISCGLLALLLAACSDETGPELPGPPAIVSLVAGDGQEGRVGTTLPLPLVVEVRDSTGRPVPDVELRWFVPTWPLGGEPREEDALTDAYGRATSRWHLGPRTGEFVMVAQWYDRGARAPIEDSARARVLPGPVTKWEIVGDTIAGLQPGDSLQIVFIGLDEYHNRSSDGDPPQWSVTPEGVVSVSGKGLVRALSPGSAEITGSVSAGPPLHVRIGVNATTEELVRVPPYSDYWASYLPAIDGSGSDILVVGATRQRDDDVWLATSLWRLQGSEVAEVPVELTQSAHVPRDVAVDEGGRNWLPVAWESKLLLSTGSTWQSVYEPPDTYLSSQWYLAVRNSGGIWMTHPSVGSGPILLHHDGTTATRYELPDTIEWVRPAEDGAGNVYLAGEADGGPYLARWDQGSLLRLTVPGDLSRVVRIRGAREAGLAWAVGRSFHTEAPGETTTVYDLLRLESATVEAVPHPLGPDGWRPLDVRHDGVPYLAGNRRLVWLENGTWHTHWLEEEGWETGHDLYVDDAGVIYLLIEKVGHNPTWPDPPSHPVESAILIIRP